MTTAVALTSAASKGCCSESPYLSLISRFRIVHTFVAGPDARSLPSGRPSSPELVTNRATGATAAVPGSGGIGGKGSAYRTHHPYRQPQPKTLTPGAKFDGAHSDRRLAEGQALASSQSTPSRSGAEPGSFGYDGRNRCARGRRNHLAHVGLRPLALRWRRAVRTRRRFRPRQRGSTRGIRGNRPVAMHCTTFRLGPPLRHSGRIWLLVAFRAGGSGARPAAAQPGMVPSPAYSAALPVYYSGITAAALVAFRSARGSIQTPAGRWIDSIYCFTMMGECYYHMGSPRAAAGPSQPGLDPLRDLLNWMLPALSYADRFGRAGRPGPSSPGSFAASQPGSGNSNRPI